MEPWKKSRLGCEKGSITVLIAMLIPVMLLLIILVLDVGQLIFEKIRLQNTVDASALVAATVQSVGLNEIADLNNDLLLEHRKLKAILGKGIWYSSAEAGKTIQFYSTVVDNINKYMDEVNFGYVQRAALLAEKVKESNLPGTTLRWVNSMSKLTNLTPNLKTLSYQYYTMTCSGNPLSGDYCPPTPVLLWTDPDDPKYIGAHDGSRIELWARKLMFTSTTESLERYTKTGETAASLEITQNTKPFILGRTRFGDLPVLKAYATAKPTGGKIYDLKPEYKPVMIR